MRTASLPTVCVGTPLGVSSRGIGTHPFWTYTSTPKEPGLRGGGENSTFMQTKSCWRHNDIPMQGYITAWSKRPLCKYLGYFQEESEGCSGRDTVQRDAVSGDDGGGTRDRAGAGQSLPNRRHLHTTVPRSRYVRYNYVYPSCYLVAKLIQALVTLQWQQLRQGTSIFLASRGVLCNKNVLN